MTFEQYLKLKLAEEAGEVAHAALKAAQFGAEDVRPGQQDTNIECMCKEMEDSAEVEQVPIDLPHDLEQLIRKAKMEET